MFVLTYVLWFMLWLTFVFISVWYIRWCCWNIWKCMCEFRSNNVIHANIYSSQLHILLELYVLVTSTYTSDVWPCSPKYVLNYFYPPAGSGMFLQDFASSHKKLTILLIIPLSWRIFLEFKKNWTRYSKHHKIYVVMSASMQLKVFTEIQICDAK